MGDVHRKEEDKALVAALLRSVEGYSDEEAGAAVDLSWQTVRNYREGRWKRLEAKTRRKIRHYLDARPPAEDRDGYAAGLLLAAREMEKKAEEFRALAATASRTGERPGVGESVGSAARAVRARQKANEEGSGPGGSGAAGGDDRG